MNKKKCGDYKDVTTFNKYGKIAKCVSCQNGKTVSVTTYKYKGSRLLSAKTTYVDNDVSSTCTYDSHGQPKIAKNYSDGVLVSENKYKNTYTKKGILSRTIITYTSFSTGISNKTVMTYYTSGAKKENPKKTVYYSAEGKVIGTYTYSYTLDKHKNITKAISKQNGKLFGKTIYKYIKIK